MSLWGRALAGAGAAGADIAGKYIDEEITMNKMQALEDMRVQTAQRMDEYHYSPDRQARVTAADVARETAVGDARNDVNLRGRQALATDPQIRQGAVDDELAKIRGVEPAKTQAAIDRATALLPIEVRRAAALADAEGRARAKYRETGGPDIAAKIAMVEKSLGRALTEAEKLGLLGLAKSQPDAGTRTVEEEFGPDGKSIARKVIDKGPRPVGGQAAEDPLLAALQAQRAAKAPKDEAKPLAARAAERMAPNVDPIASMGTSDLRRIANIPGHVNQKAARAELARREEEAATQDTSGFGYGNAPGQ
jgi:hypothetical protein